jgi:ATP/maltotriose-dependent transcriptional regulator MalT
MGHGLSGETDLAFTQAAHAEQLANGRGLNNLLAVVRLARSFAWISKGRYAEACEELLPLYDHADASFHQRESFSGVMVLAEAAVHAQRVDEARAVIEELEKTAEVTPAPILHTGLLYARPVLADDDDAEALFLDGLRHDMTRWPWVRARLELAYGSWLRRQRRVGESRAPLRSAQTVFDVMGATFWAEQARTELRAAGERTLVRSSAVGLSAQEWQIARMAADGLSNREIAECLYLSPRTVGSHLYRIFPKLDITSRAQLAARLHLV